MMGNNASTPSTPLTTSNLANLGGTSASKVNNNKAADDLSSISSLSSLSDSEDELSDEEEEEEPVKKKARGIAVVGTKKKGLVLVGGLPTPSPTSDGKKETPKDGTKRTRELKGKEDGKSYLNAGLYYNKDSKNALSGLALFLKASKGKGKKAEKEGAWMDKEDSFILPLPVHYGDTLIEDEKDFRLSFDIMRDFAWDREDVPRAIKALPVGEDELERREKSRKPERYGKIAKNVYVERKPEKSDMPAICHCKKPANDDEEGCGEQCINRMMQYSCDPKTCPTGDKCSNMPLSLQKGVPEGKGGLRVVWTGNRGFGLKTSVDIKKGDFVIEYRGEIISRNESYRRVLTTYKDSHSYYFLDYDGWECIDAGTRGNAARFINHSCGPNLHVVRWKLSGLEEYQMGIFAKEDIKAGSELTYDYGWQDFSAIAPGAGEAADMYAEDPSRQKCYCGAGVCSGFLGGKKKEKEAEKGSKLVKRKKSVKVKVNAVKSPGKKDAGLVTIVTKRVGVVKK